MFVPRNEIDMKLNIRVGRKKMLQLPYNRFIQAASMSLLILVFCLSACSPMKKMEPSGLSVSTEEFEIEQAPINQKVQPPEETNSKVKNCPGLDSNLYQLSLNDDPSEAAEQMGLRVKTDMVQVLLVLKSEDNTFLSDFGIDTGNQSGTQLQVYVPFNQLCELATHESVLAIRPAAQAIQ